MLRDLLVRLDGAGTWPCDEINHIWRHGNIRHQSDALQPGQATSDVKRFINKKFAQLARSRGLDTIIEKTCANSLRVPFVERIIDDAKYVFIVRDGIDAAVSASKRWHAGLDLQYRFRKARFVPLSDMPYYCFQFIGNQLRRLSAKGMPLNCWGPIFDGMAEIQAVSGTIGICAHQWQACVEMANASLAMLPDDRVYRVKYEDFVDNPVKEFRGIAEFAGKAVTAGLAESLRSNVLDSRKGSGRSELGAEDMLLLRNIMGRTLAANGYA